MTNAEIIQAIRNEIERRFREYNKDSNHHLQAAEDAELLDFLSTLESEKPIPAELEEAAEAEENMIIEEAEEDDYGRPEIASTHIYNAFIHGAKWDRSQMMQEAVEGVVVGDGEHCWIDANIPMSWMYQDKVCIVKDD